MVIKMLDNLKSGVNLAADALSDATQNLIEKGRINAQLNKLKAEMRTDVLIQKNAFLELGRYYYSKQTSDSFQEKDISHLFEIIKTSAENVSKAKIRYNLLLKIKKEEGYKFNDKTDIDETVPQEHNSNAADFGKMISLKAEQAKAKGAEFGKEVFDKTAAAAGVAKAKAEPIADAIKEKTIEIAGIAKEKATPVAEKISAAGQDVVKKVQVKGEELKDIATEKTKQFAKNAKAKAEEFKEKAAKKSAEVADDIADIADDANADAITVETLDENTIASPHPELVVQPDSEVADSSNVF